MRVDDDERKLAQILESARKIEAGDGNRKHHLVPASYLRRWEEGGRIRVTEIDAPKTYCVRPEVAGRETDFYRLEADGIDPDELPPLAMEVLLSVIEGKAKQAVDALLYGRDLTREELEYMSWFLALQVTRGRAFRAQMRESVHETFKLQYGDMDEDAIRRRLAENGGPVTPEAVAAAKDGLRKVAAGGHPTGCSLVRARRTDRWRPRAVLPPAHLADVRGAAAARDERRAGGRTRRSRGAPRRAGWVRRRARHPLPTFAVAAARAAPPRPGARGTEP